MAFQKVTQSIKIFPSDIKIGKEQLNIIQYAYDIALIGKNEIEIRKLFVEMENISREFGLQINQEKTKYMVVERKNSLNKNKIGHLKIKYYKFERMKNFKYLGVNEDNNNQITVNKETKTLTKHIICYKNFLKIKTYQRN